MPKTSNKVAPLEDVFELIANGTATDRSSLSKLFGVSPSTMTERVNTLKYRGLIIETTGRSSGGRPKVLLSPSVEQRNTLIIDCCYDHLIFVVQNSQGEVINLIDTTVSTNSPLEEVFDSASTLLTKVNNDFSIKCACVIVPAPIDPETLDIGAASLLPGWEHHSLKEGLSKIIDVPIHVENDANCLAVGFSSSEYKSVLALKIDKGLGAGIVLEEKLYRGFSGMAGDFSHTAINKTDFLCSCGRYGCLEVVSSGNGLLKRVKAKGVDINNIDELVEVISKGDPIASQEARFSAEALGEVLAVAVNLFNPQLVVLGGRLATLDIITAVVRSSLYSACHPSVTKNISIIPSTDPHVDEWRGGGILATQTLFSV